MSFDPETARIVRSWLKVDEHESADRVLRHVLDQLATTPQRRAGWPARRMPEMTNAIKLAIGAAAVVVASLVGFSFLSSGSSPGVGGPAVSPAPSPSAPPSPSPNPSPSPSPEPDFPPSGDLQAGVRYRAVLEDVPFTFTVPTSDWISNGEWGIDKGAGIVPEGAGFIMWLDTPVGVFSDPCIRLKGPEIGTSIADLAAAVAAMPGTDLVSAPTDVTVGGFPAKEVAIQIRDDIACHPNLYYLWYAPNPDYARYATVIGSTIRTWIIDVDGTPVWIDSETYPGAGPGPGSEIQQIIDSIQFE